MVDEIVRENRVVYGITTGFGKFARTVIGKDKLEYVLGTKNVSSYEMTILFLKGASNEPDPFARFGGGESAQSGEDEDASCPEDQRLGKGLFRNRSGDAATAH